MLVKPLLCGMFVVGLLLHSLWNTRILGRLLLAWSAIIIGGAVIASNAWRSHWGLDFSTPAEYQRVTAGLGGLCTHLGLSFENIVWLCFSLQLLLIGMIIVVSKSADARREILHAAVAFTPCYLFARP